MEEIVLKHIDKSGCTITYDFSVSDGLIGFFSGKPFLIEYSEEIGAVPDAIAAIPFVSNVLPIIWLTDSALVIQDLDKSFYNCIPDLKTGYETMFPETAFRGTIKVTNLVSCDRPSTGKCAMFYSGGLDSVQTLVSHLDEKPDLISIWGSDIRYENAEGWSLVHTAIEEASRKFNLPDIVIHSTFREFDNEGILDRQFHSQLKDGWWHGVKHGIGLLGHVAPYAYLHGLSTMYIASTNCPADGPVRCASNPLTDNHVRFANCKAVHDGFEFSRQDKVHNVAEFVRKTGNPISLHVCWESQNGNNCCRCEKCYRTMAGLLAEGEDPADYGFPEIDFRRMRSQIIGGNVGKVALHEYWTHIHNRACQNEQMLRAKPYWRQFKWIVKADFEHPETLKMPLIYRIRHRLSKFRFYQGLHQLKVMLHTDIPRK